MKELEPDLVITYTIKPNIYGGFSAGRMKIPYILIIFITIPQDIKRYEIAM